jgi:Flp pilus assembly pilin Flp
MHRLSSAARKGKLRRDTRGTTIVEYALLLFVVLVVCAVGLKVLGMTLAHKFGSADKHMAGQGESTSSAQGSGGDNASSSGGAAAAGGGAKAAAKSSDGINKDPTNAAGGGDGETPSQGGLPLIVRFALIALGVVGAAAAFFAIAKGKPAG